MPFQHQSLAAGKWFELSLCSQMGNIGSEISRARRWQNKDTKNFESAVFRAIELIDLTLSDKRWKNRYKEIARIKEVVGDAYLGGTEYNSTFESLEKYFNHFAYAARNAVGR
jgi:hypothetical protein